MIEIVETILTDELKREVYKGFTDYAIQMTGHNEKFDPVAWIARTENGRFVGTLVGELFWGAFHIKYVYVADQYQGRKIASILMDHALKYAQDHLCPFVFVETMSFQALGFYQKFGFQLEYTRPGYAHSTSFHYLRKDL